MERSRPMEWLSAPLIVGLVYLAMGRLFTLPVHHVQAWRLAAWATSAVAFALHIAWEHGRRHESAGAMALHAALAVALGGFALAAWAGLRAFATTGVFRPAWVLALVLWPLLTGLPAFGVARLAGAVLARVAPVVTAAGPPGSRERHDA